MNTTPVDSRVPLMQCTCGYPEFENIVHRADAPCYVIIESIPEPCTTHRTERSVQTTLPCPWCVIDELKANNAALRQSATARAWQPIETAPKSGTEILGWRADCGTIMVRWSCCAEMFTDEENDGLTEDDLWKQDWFAADFAHGARMDGDLVPTHWMPLPEDPK